MIAEAVQRRNRLGGAVAGMRQWMVERFAVPAPPMPLERPIWRSWPGRGRVAGLRGRLSGGTQVSGLAGIAGLGPLSGTRPASTLAGVNARAARAVCGGVPGEVGPGQALHVGSAELLGGSPGLGVGAGLSAGGLGGAAMGLRCEGECAEPQAVGTGAAQAG